MTHLRSDGLFRLGRSLELRAYGRDLLGFDDLPAEEKSFLGVLLDFVGIDRAGTAKGWTSAPEARANSKDVLVDSEDYGPLFETRNR